MKFFYFLIVMNVLCTLRAQVVKEPLSVQYAGSGIYSKKFSDVFSGTFNQAALAQLKTGGFGVYGERRFLLEEMNNYAAILAVPTSSGVFGFEGDYFGSAAFHESELGFLYARKITQKIDIGAKFNYYSVTIPGYGNASAVNFEAGTIFHLTDRLHTGIHIYNPGSSKLGKNGRERLSSIYRVGIGYEVSEIVFVSTEIVKQENQRVNINAGLQYNLEKIILRAGISTLASNSYAAIGLQLGFARVDINMSYHPQLGFTPGLLLLLNFKKEDKE